MIDENAYAAVIVNSFEVPRRRRWLQLFAVLNAAMIGSPLLFAVVAVAYALLAANEIQIRGSSGTLGIENVSVVAGYLVLPNIIMAIFWDIGRRGRRNADRLQCVEHACMPADGAGMAFRIFPNIKITRAIPAR